MTSITFEKHAILIVTSWPRVFSCLDFNLCFFFQTLKTCLKWPEMFFIGAVANMMLFVLVKNIQSAEHFQIWKPNIVRMNVISLTMWAWLKWTFFWKNWEFYFEIEPRKRLKAINCMKKKGKKTDDGFIPQKSFFNCCCCVTRIFCLVFVLCVSFSLAFPLSVTPLLPSTDHASFLGGGELPHQVWQVSQNH